MRSATLLTFAIFGLKALAQESSSASGDQFTIQTDPATPTSSPTGSSLTGSNTGSSASTATPASSITGAAAPASTSFPVACADSCREISQTLSQCGVGNDLDAQCLCTVQNEQNYLRCVQCALTLNPSETAARSYQALLDAFIDQCANAPQNPTTLPNVTVTLVPTSISGSATSSPTIITGSASAPASSRSASASSSRVFSSVSLPFSSISRGPLPSSSNVAASSSASPTGAARRSVELVSGGGFLPGGLWSGLLLAGMGAVGVRLAGLA